MLSSSSSAATMVRITNLNLEDKYTWYCCGLQFMYAGPTHDNISQLHFYGENGEQIFRFLGYHKYMKCNNLWLYFNL